MPPDRHLRSDRVLLTILAAALSLRLIASGTLDPPRVSDADEYHRIAVSIIQGDGVSLDGRPTAFRLPGYPFLLAAVYAVAGPVALPVRFLQALLDTLACWLVYRIGRRLVPERSALFAAAIYALFPLQILYVTTLLSETLFVALVLVSVDLLLSSEGRTWWLAAGLAIGCAILVRSAAIVLPWLALARTWPSHAIRRRSIGWLLAGTMLAVLPWLMRNEAQFGRWTLTSSTGVNFWIGNHAGASGSYSFPGGNPLDGIPDEFDRSDAGMRLGLQFWRDEPISAAMNVVRKFAHFFGMDAWLIQVQSAPTAEGPSPSSILTRHTLDPRWAVATHGPFMLVAVLAVVGLAAVGSSQWTAWRPVFVLLALWIFAHLVMFGGARFRMPLHPFLMIAAVHGWTQVTMSAVPLSRARRSLVVLFVGILAAGWVAEIWMYAIRSGQ